MTSPIPSQNNTAPIGTSRGDAATSLLLRALVGGQSLLSLIACGLIARAGGPLSGFHKVYAFPARLRLRHPAKARTTAASNQKIPTQRVSSRVMKRMPRARSPPLAPYNMIASYAPCRPHLLGKTGAGNERTMGAASRHLHDHLGPGVAVFQIGDGCRDF